MKRILLSIAVSLCCLQFVSAQYKVDRLLISGRVALHYEDYVLSIQYFNQAISQKPYLWEPWQYRAIAKFFLDDWQGATADATKAIELNPYITTLYDLRGISRIRQEQFSEAIADYTKAIALEPDNQNFWYNRAVCYMENKDYDNAQLQLDTIISKWQKYAQPYMMKAEVFMHQRDTAQAEAWLDRAIEIDQYNADAWRVKAFIALVHGQWHDADSLFSRAIHLKPKNAMCYANRANARLKLNNLRGAMSDYDTALDIAPNDILAHYNRGLLRLHVGDDNRAIEDFDFVLNLEPENIMALFNRATLLDRTGDLRAAIRDYTKVIEKFPNFWTGLEYRAACYRRLGQTALAEKDEFRVLKARIDKRYGAQQHWSSAKLAAVRKMSDIDPEKYSHLVVNDEIDDSHEYKSEYRGKIQNRQATEKFMPYIALTVSNVRSGVSSYTPFDKDVEAELSRMRTVADAFGSNGRAAMPHLGEVGDGKGVLTLDLVDRLTEAIRQTRDTADAELMVLMRSVARSSALDYEEALRDIDLYLSSHPESIVALWQRSVCGAIAAEFAAETSPQETAMRNAGVKSDFRKLLRLTASQTGTPDTGNPFVLYCYGTFCARLGEYAEAIDLLGKAIEADPTLPQAYYNRALAYIQQNETAKATTDLSKAGELGLYQAYSIMKSLTKKK